MSIKTPHDPRTFRQFAKVEANGSVNATVMVADGAPDPVDGEGNVYVDVSKHYGVLAVTGIAVPGPLVATLKTTTAEVAQRRQDLALAEADAEAAQKALDAALTEAAKA